MKIPTDSALLAEIEAFIARNGMAPSRFGVEAIGDGALVKQLREGRSLTLRSAQRVASYMAEFRAPTRSAAA